MLNTSFSGFFILSSSIITLLFVSYVYIYSVVANVKKPGHYRVCSGLILNTLF